MTNVRFPTFIIHPDNRQKTTPVTRTIQTIHPNGRKPPKLQCNIFTTPTNVTFQPVRRMTTYTPQSNNKTISHKKKFYTVKMARHVREYLPVISKRKLGENMTPRKKSPTSTQTERKGSSQHENPSRPVRRFPLTLVTGEIPRVRSQRKNPSRPVCRISQVFTGTLHRNISRDLDTKMDTHRNFAHRNSMHGNFSLGNFSLGNISLRNL